MAKLSILGQAVVAGILLFSEGALGSQSVTPSEESLRGEVIITPEKTGRIDHQGVNQKSNIDLKLLEYFEHEDTTGENEKYPSSPRRYPVFYFHQSIWKNGEGNKLKQDEGILARILRRLQVDDSNAEIGQKKREDDYLNYVGGYNGDYHAVHVHEHEEELITDDDGSGDIPSLDDDPTSGKSRPSRRPTAAPTPIEDHPLYNVNNMEPTATPITDTVLLADRPPNSIILRIVLAVVKYDTMTKDDLITIVHMAGRAMSLVLNEDKDIPFEVIDRVDFYEGDREWNRTLEVTPSQPTSFRGQGVPVQRDASKSKEEEFLAKLILDNVVISRGEHSWWELSAVYTVWRKGDFAPIERRPILREIENMCSNSIEKSIDQEIYWESLMNVGIGDHGIGDPDLIIPGKNYFTNDKGIVDAKDVGDEYDMSVMRCPNNRPVKGDAYECPSNNTHPSNNTYPTVIADNLVEIEWGTREWVGFGLMCSTMVFVISLSLIADYLSRKRRKELLWGAALTPVGVDDFLQVGWRIYEHPPEDQPAEGLTPDQVQQQQAQLYLQIYEKGGEGYNDENSLLKGGVERQLFAPSMDAYAADTDTPPVKPDPSQNHHESSADENIINRNKSS